MWGYRDPFRNATTSPARIDAGVDKCGSGVVFFLGNALVINVGRPSGTSTFGDSMPVYQLLDGPAAGKYVFIDEHCTIVPGYKNGDHVTSDTVQCRLYGCVEIGWSDGVGSEAWNSGTYSEGGRSVIGQNFSDLLVALGAEGGLTTGRPLVGTLPPGYPDWAALAKDEAMYEDWKKGWNLAKKNKPLPKNANVDVTLGWNVWHHDLSKNHVHNAVLPDGTSIQTGKPD